jgi:hypothetical protein
MSTEEKSVNGVGPSWFSPSLRRKLTTFSKVFFDEQCWVSHDIQYTTGGTQKDKERIDKEFLRDMIASVNKRSIHKRIVGYPLATFYYINVALFGHPSFNFNT